ncbi:MAG: DUF4118 domain-containing protein [Betaproteobacteria bacterium]
MTAAKEWTGYAWAAAGTALCTLAGWSMSARFDIVNIAMLYVLAVLLIALRFGRGPTIATSILSVAAFDVVFVPPQGVFSIDDVQYLFTFVIMLAVGLVVSGLRARVRRQESAHARLVLEAETERMRSTLLASISHDLRTPLAVMSGASSSLAEYGAQMSAEERRALAQGIYEHASKMSEHVAKLLQMTRLESGAIVLERDWAAFAEIAGAVLRRLGARMGAHHVVVELPDDLPLLHVDAALIEQALGNLLENAATHTPPGTVVRLRAQRRDPFLVISVEDSGGGLSETDAERVFAKFQHAAEGRVAGGIGLGLSICRSIVQLHGGKAWAEQLPEGGVAFRFTLPLAAPPAVPAEAPSSLSN